MTNFSKNNSNNKNESKNKNRYIINCIGSGEKLWRCEVCCKDVHRMFFQIELELLLKSSGKWVTTSNCRNLLGHEECLIGMRR